MGFGHLLCYFFNVFSLHFLNYFHCIPGTASDSGGKPEEVSLSMMSGTEAEVHEAKKHLFLYEVTALSII